MMTITKIRDKELLKEVCADSGIGMYDEKKLVGVVLYTWENKDLYLDAIAIHKKYRNKARALIRAGYEVIKKGKSKHIYGDSQSSAGEKLLKLIWDKTGILTIDMGKLDRIINGETVEEHGTWEKYV